jgi:predicted dehydrogenase
MIKTVSIAGVGSRGAECYGRDMFNKKDKFKIVSLYDINKEKLKKYAPVFEIADENCFCDEDKFFEKKRSDICLITMLDKDHVRLAKRAISLGYDILLEKPISASKEECLDLLDFSRKYNSKILVCHVLRYTVMVKKLKEILDSGEIGKIVLIQHTENVAYWHQAHSYVRGNWRKSEDTAPMIMAKCCHDLDLLQYFAGSKCKTISSIGSLSLFKKKNSPERAAERCLDCAIAGECPYNAVAIYIDNWKKLPSHLKPVSWPQYVLTDKPLSESTLMEALQNGPYGKCVYACDNNVVDNQIVLMEFENGIHASLTMTAFTKYGGRNIRFFGTMGELCLDENKDTISLLPYGKEDKIFKISELSNNLSGHGGGDTLLVDALYELTTGHCNNPETSLEKSIESHLMAIAAEDSRLSGGKLVTIKRT